MKKLLFPLSLLLIMLLYSCATPQYFHDESSYMRQKELQSCRSGNVLTDIACGIGSILFAVATDTEVGYIPSDQQFKTLKIVNPTKDTMYVNMLTDLVWDETGYCDFMDIRIPPEVNCRVLVPIGANYNLYFSHTPQADDDEMLEINTADLGKVSVYPGLTNLSSSEQ